MRRDRDQAWAAFGYSMIVKPDGGGLFDRVHAVLDGVFKGVAWVLLAPPFLVIAVLVGLLAVCALGL